MKYGYIHTWGSGKAKVRAERNLVDQQPRLSLRPLLLRKEAGRSPLPYIGADMSTFELLFGHMLRVGTYERCTPLS